MFFILVILFIGSIFNNDLWVLFFIFLIYLILTAKTRRKKIVEKLILSAIANRKRLIMESSIYYEAAKKYAIEKGAIEDKEIVMVRVIDVLSFIITVANTRFDGVFRDMADFRISVFRSHDGSAGFFIKLCDTDDGY